MWEIAVSVATWIGSIIHTHREEILAVATVFIAFYTIVLAYIGRRQNKISKIIQRAYVSADMDGINDTTEGNLVGQVIFKNVGHLPANKLSWLVKISSGDEQFMPPKIKNRELEGVGVLPIGAEWPKGSDGIPIPQEGTKPEFMYVWGRITYKDGIRWRKRYLNFCHRYPMEKSTTPAGGGYCIDVRHGRYHERGNDAN